MSVEVLDRAPSLEELAATANREHHAAMAAAGTLLDHAIVAGEALMAIRALLPGGWHVWLDENFEGSRKTARQYIRFAFYRDQIASASTTEEALARLRGLPWTTGLTATRGNERLQRAKERSRAAREALRRQEQDEAVRRRGGKPAEAYSLVRRALQQLQWAIDAETVRESKEGFRAAMGCLHDGEDLIARAQKLSSPRSGAA